MGKEKRLFKSRENKGRAELAAFLHGLADQIDEGKLQLGVGEEARELVLGEELAYVLEVDRKKKGKKGKKYSLEVEIEWSGVKPAQADMEEAAAGEELASDDSAQEEKG